jgi:hypothetical protein
MSCSTTTQTLYFEPSVLPFMEPTENFIGFPALARMGISAEAVSLMSVYSSM